MTAGGAVPGRAPLGRRQLGDLDELNPLDALHDELRDPVTAPQHDLRTGVVVDQAHEDLAAIAGVHGAWCVDDRETRPGGKARPRMHEPRVAVGQGDGHPGADEGPLTGREHHVSGAVQVNAGITGQSGHRNREPPVEPGERNLDR